MPPLQPYKPSRPYASLKGTYNLTQNPNSTARDFAVQFLYQCETEKLFYFSDGHFRHFVSYFEVPDASVAYMQRLCETILSNIEVLDQKIGDVSKNWKVSRMAATDRIILRLALQEILESDTPPKVILNEAIELAKKYGTEHSGAFVNGILDTLLKSIQPPN